MVHLTNDYRKLLRKNGPKAALSLCVALALSGGLVSAEGKTYYDISPYGSSREALEGDPIVVEWMRGGEGTLKAGTDETGNVLIHHLVTWENPKTYVKGKKITIEDRDPSAQTANWGGKMYIGGDTTESVTMEGLHAGNQSETTIYGRTISMGTLGTGNGHFTIGNKNTESVTINDFGAAEGSSTIINGRSVSMGSLNNYKGTVTIGNRNTNSVTINDFGAAEGSSTTINGRIVSMGSLNNYKSTVTINAGGAFKVEKDEKLQEIGVNNGGGISITAGSVRAGKLYATNPGSHIDVHASGDDGVYLSNGIGATDNSKISIDGPSITIGKSSGTNDKDMSISDTGKSDIILKGKNLYVKGNLNIFASSLIAAETGTIQLGEEGKHAYFVITGSQVSLGNENTQTNIYGSICDTENIEIEYDNNNYPHIKKIIPSSIDIHGRDILIDSVNAPNVPDSILTHGGSKLTVGDAGSNVWLKGRLFNTGSSTTIKGQAICISAPKVIDGKLNAGGEENTAVRTTGGYASITNIGDENTESVRIDGGTYATGMSSLSVHGRNVSFSNAKGIALCGTDHEYGNPTKGTVLLVGGEETENLTVKGQVSNNGAAEMKLSGQHITIDSTEYDGYEGSYYSGQYPQAILASSNNIDAGVKDTMTIYINGGLNAMGGSINVQGKDITINASDYFKTHEVKAWDSYKNISVILKDSYIAHASGGNVIIGSADTDNVHLYGSQLLADGDTNNDNNGHIKVQGHNILIDGNDTWAGWTNKGTLTIGMDTSDSIQIQGGIHAQGSGGALIQGKRIAVSSNDKEHYALDGVGGNITVGSPAAQSINVDGGIQTIGSTISLTGRDISISKGKQENAIHTDGGTVSITATGGEDAHISGPVRNDKGTIKISLSDKASHLDSQVFTKNGGITNISLNNKASWNPAGNTSNFTTYTGNDGIIYLDNNTHQTVTVSAFKDADTRIHEDIYGSGNTGNDAIHIDNTYTGNTHFWLVNREGTDKGVVGTILASAGTKESPKAGTNSVMVMAALNSAENNDSSDISQFTADHFAAYGMNSLFFKTYSLGTEDSKVKKDGNISDTTKGNLYDQDLIITGVTNHTTNEHGQYTPTVSTALSGSSLMYYTWRTENDKMLQRVGDLRENEGEETGLWARIRGSRIGKSHSDRGFKNQYKVYEIGYDAKTEDNDRMKSFTGIAFSYLDGKGYYTDGRGTNQAASAAIYHTDIHKTGHYLDLVFRIRHMNERLHTHTTVDTDIGPITEDHSASMDTTGLSFSAEYGRKKFVGNGWYVEPQTQWTLGYLGPNQYEMDNGTRVEQPGITSFVGRVGFNLGRQVNPNSIVYLKANVYHEFGGHSPIHLYAGDESVSFTDTFDDTWFEYGVGFAMKLGSRFSLYGDFEKSAGSHFYKDWQWNAGIRYSF